MRCTYSLIYRDTGIQQSPAPLNNFPVRLQGNCDGKSLLQLIILELPDIGKPPKSQIPCSFPC